MAGQATTAPPPGPGGLAVAAFVCGLVGALFGLMPLLFFVAFPLGVLGLIFGIVARRRGKSGMAVAGVVLGSLAVVLAVVGVAVLADVFDDLDERPSLQEQRQEERQREATDVILDGCFADGLGFMTATVTVTNNSSERSNYFGSVVFETADGSQQLASVPLVVNGLEPGQTTTEEANTFTVADEFTCRVVDVERYSDE
ncbi:MAG: DUF4190 domain-containing protein [Acidimicrobiales bacterium]